MTQQTAPAPVTTVTPAPAEYQHRGWILAVMCLALVMVVAGVSMLATSYPSTPKLDSCWIKRPIDAISVIHSPANVTTSFLLLVMSPPRWLV